MRTTIQPAADVRRQPVSADGPEFQTACCARILVIHEDAAAASLCLDVLRRAGWLLAADILPTPQRLARHFRAQAPGAAQAPQAVGVSNGTSHAVAPPALAAGSVEPLNAPSAQPCAPPDPAYDLIIAKCASVWADAWPSLRAFTAGIPLILLRYAVSGAEELPTLAGDRCLAMADILQLPALARDLLAAKNPALPGVLLSAAADVRPWRQRAASVRHRSAAAAAPNSMTPRVQRRVLARSRIGARSEPLGPAPAEAVPPPPLAASTQPRTESVVPLRRAAVAPLPTPSSEGAAAVLSPAYVLAALTAIPTFGVARCDRAGRIIAANLALATILGYPSAEQMLADGDALRIPRPNGHAAAAAPPPTEAGIGPAEVVWTGRNGGAVIVRYSGRELRREDGVSEGCVIIAEDITAQRAQVADLRRRAATDSLTGLANHGQFALVLEREILRAKRAGRTLAVLCMDVDGLKWINDAEGHLAGNQAIQRTARILASCCRGVDMVARVGGVEFALVAPEMDAAGADLVCRRIAERCAADHQQPRLSVSVGAAIFPRDGQVSQQLLQAADQALYRMKRGHVAKLGHVAAGSAPHSSSAPGFSLRVPAVSA